MCFSFYSSRGKFVSHSDCNLSSADGGKVESGRPERRAIVHDLNNDLGIIIAACDLFKTSPHTQTEATARIDTIKATAQHMADRLAVRPTSAGRGAEEAREK